MDSRNLSPRKPTIVIKFKNPAMAGEEDEELGEGYLQFGAYGGVKKMKTVGSAGGGGGVPAVCCQVDSCGADLAPAKRYHRRHKVCEVHAKAPVVVVAGLPQRFCQQCSRFHEVLEFDEARRSCRSRLAGHNERRRKSAQMDEGVGSMHQGSSITIAPVHSQAKQFQIR